MEMEVISSLNLKTYGKYQFFLNSSIAALLWITHEQLEGPEPNRQCLLLHRYLHVLQDNDTLESLQLQNGDKLYSKGLGPLVPYKMAFLAAYARPFLIYLCFYIHSSLCYPSVSIAVHTDAFCNTLHYLKRLLETIFVHRFSHTTMPLRNLYRKCAYYWAFITFIAWNLNNLHHRPPHMSRVCTGLMIFLLCEFSNFSVHIALRNLRAPGSTKQRKIPMPNGNVFTNLFNLVSCPNYMYEIFAWIAFAIMTSCWQVLLFAFVGTQKMAIWALIKYRNYKMEFKDYPKGRRAIFPFML